MRIDVFSIFPGYFDGALDASLLGRARTAGLLDVRVHGGDDAPQETAASLAVRPASLLVLDDYESWTGDWATALDPRFERLDLEQWPRSTGCALVLGMTDMSGFSLKSARFAEYANTGAGATVNADRPQLTADQAAVYTARRYLAGTDGWDPVG